MNGHSDSGTQHRQGRRPASCPDGRPTPRTPRRSSARACCACEPRGAGAATNRPRPPAPLASGQMIPPRAHAILVLVRGEHVRRQPRCAPRSHAGKEQTNSSGELGHARVISRCFRMLDLANPSRVTGNQLAQELPSELGGWANANGCKPRNRQRAGSAFRFGERLVKVETEPLRWTSGQTSSACFACGRVRWWYWSVSRRIIPGRRRLVGD